VATSPGVKSDIFLISLILLYLVGKWYKISATEKILNLLSVENFENLVYDNLEKAVLSFKILEKINKSKKLLILSPGAKSFGLFNNEYDRGEKFNKIIKKYFK
jgi:UDP-N-acetylmuramoylalanine--D-glutamate ligase